MGTSEQPVVTGYPLGHPFGRPFQPEKHRAVLRECLRVIETASTPGMMVPGTIPF